MVQPLWKNFRQLLIKPTKYLPYDPSMSLLGIHPSEMKINVHENIYTQIFIAALITIAKVTGKEWCEDSGVDWQRVSERRQNEEAGLA